MPVPDEVNYRNSPAYKQYRSCTTRPVNAPGFKVKDGLVVIPPGEVFCRAIVDVAGTTMMCPHTRHWDINGRNLSNLRKHVTKVHGLKIAGGKGDLSLAGHMEARVTWDKVWAQCQRGTITQVETRTETSDTEMDNAGSSTGEVLGKDIPDTTSSPLHERSITVQSRIKPRQIPKAPIDLTSIEDCSEDSEQSDEGSSQNYREVNTREASPGPITEELLSVPMTLTKKGNPAHPKRAEMKSLAGFGPLCGGEVCRIVKACPPKKRDNRCRVWAKFAISPDE